MNVCAKFVPIPLVDVEIFLWISKNFDLLVTLDKKSVDHQSQRESSSRNHDCRVDFVAIHPISVEILQSGPKWWTIIAIF